MKYGILVKEFMTTSPISISPNESAKSAANLMISKGVGSLLVLNEDRLVGILTEKDLVEKIISGNKSPEKILVKDIMSTDVFGIGPDVDLYDAAKLMTEKNVRRLPIIEDDKLIGLVTEKDILKIKPSVIDILMQKANIMGGKIKSKSGVCNICGEQRERLILSDSMNICEFCDQK